MLRKTKTNSRLQHAVWVPVEGGDMQLAALISFGLCRQLRIFALLFIRPSSKRETREMEGMHHVSKKVAACQE